LFIPGFEKIEPETSGGISAPKLLSLGKDGAAEFFIGEPSQVIVGGETVDLQNRVTQKSQWRGPEDSSARGIVKTDGDTLSITVRVTDDILVNDSQEGRFWDGDCAEIFLDLRGRTGAAGGKEDFLQIVAPAPVRPGLNGKYMTLGARPPEGLSVTSSRTPAGYDVTAKIPLASLKDIRSPLGFNIAVGDADGPGGRKTQLMWAPPAGYHAGPAEAGAVSLSQDSKKN
jgi:hypothetical protein